MRDQRLVSRRLAVGDLRGYVTALTRIRRFEEKVHALRTDGAIVGSVHLCNGQEAIAVGGVAALQPADAVFATYRGHGWAIACGAPLRALFAELLGRATGVNGGRGGSAYLSAPDHGFYGENSIVGGGAPIATGAALASAFDGSGRVALTVLGDGAMNQGSVHEAMNFAAALDLPVVFCCENNRYSELTPIADMVRNDRLVDRAAAYGMPGARVDGNDVDAVRMAVLDAVERARRGEGPSLIEAMTQRLVGHYIGDAEQYRPSGEVDAAIRDEPIVRLQRALLDRGTAEEELHGIDADVRREVDEAAALALADPLSDAARAQEGCYSDA